MYVKDALGRVPIPVGMAIVKFEPGGATNEFYVYGNERVAMISPNTLGNTPSRIQHNNQKMKTVIISLFLLSCVSSKMYEAKQTSYEGKWINVEYNQAIRDEKEFSELSKMSYNFLYFKNDKISLAFRYEQISEPGKIKFSDKNKTTFDYFNFKYQSDTIFMKREDKMIAKFIKYN